MKQKKLYLIITIIVTGLFFANSLNAQETEVNSPLYVGADIVNRYIWRGMGGGTTPNVQPTVEYYISNWTVGTWGSTDIFGNAKELDIYTSFSLKGVSLTFTDYFWSMDKRYFNYSNEKTGHNLEFALSYENEKYPFSISVNTMFYGEDKKVFYDFNETDLNKNNFSTYFEATYTFEIKQNLLEFFAGATPYTGMYGNDFAVVYTGFTATKEIAITEKFSLPIFTTISVNPQTEDFFVIFGISL